MAKRIHLSAKLLLTWEPDPLEQTQVLVVSHGNLLQQLANTTSQPEHCDMILQHQAGIKELTLHALYREGVPPRCHRLRLD